MVYLYGVKERTLFGLIFALCASLVVIPCRLEWRVSADALPCTPCPVRDCPGMTQ